jgi:hypothetical protein
MNSIKAIPTMYAGVMYDSKLEARWAKMLDVWGVKREYEPEDMQLSDGEYYRPDFYLPEMDVWLEAKGNHGERIYKTRQLAADMWEESSATDIYDLNAPTTVFGLEPYKAISDWKEIPEENWDRPHLVGLDASKEGYSIIPVTCPRGNHTTFIAPWQSYCRVCKYDYGDGFKTFCGKAEFKIYTQGFARI